MEACNVFMDITDYYRDLEREVRVQSKFFPKLLYKYKEN